MKILLINRWVGYNEGGNETHIKDLIEQFLKRGHDVTVITSEGNSLDFLRSNNNLHLDLRFVKTNKIYFSYSKLGLLLAFTFLTKSFWLVAKMIILEKKRFDIVSVHFSLEAFLARFIKLFFSIPYVMVMAGDHVLEILEAKRADGQIQISKFMAKQCEKYGFSPTIIPKGFDKDHFKVLDKNKCLSEIQNLADFEEFSLRERFIILTVCRLDPRKNLETLVRAANLLVNKFRYKSSKSFSFLIVGDGVEKHHLERLVKNYKLEETIKFLGSVPNRSHLLPKLYNASDLFVLPTLYEGFGWVFVEAMMCGLPILTTTCGSNAEVVGEVGELIEPKNPELLAKKILALSEDQKRLVDMRALGLKKSSEYSWSETIELYEKYFLKVCAREKGFLSTISQKIKTAGFLFTDLFFLVSYFLKDLFKENHNTAKNSNWDSSGQVGSNDL